MESDRMNDIATKPNDLEQLFVLRANAGDMDGLVSLYERDAVLNSEDGEFIAGRDEIRNFLANYVAERRVLSRSKQFAALSNGELALTASRHNSGDVSVEIARRQPDGSWLWVVDRFSIGRLSPNRPQLPHWLP